MRILIAVHGFPPREAGVWTYHHAQGLSQRHSVWVYTRASDAARPEFSQWEERDRQVTIRRVVHSHFAPFHAFNGFRVPIIDEQFLGFADEIQPDVIHVEHTFGLSGSMVGAASRRGWPVVLSLYDYWLLCQRAFLLYEDGSRCPGPRHAFDCVTCVEGPADRALPRAPAPAWRLPLHDYRQAVMRDALDAADVVTACSPHLQHNITRLYGLPPERVRSVPLGVPPLAGPVVRRPGRAVRIRYLGAIAGHKGVFVLAHAAKALAGLNAEVHLHGPAAPQVREELLAIHPGLIVHPAYGREDLPALLGDTDVQVVPSLAAETFSFVIREAALAKVAVVASRIGAIPDFISDGETGLLVAAGDAGELAAALRRLVLDPALRARLAAAHGPMRSVDDYTTEMEGLYQAAIAAAATRRRAAGPAAP